MYLHHLTRRLLQAALISLAATLAACGGGGSSTPADSQQSAQGGGNSGNQNPPPVASFTIELAAQKAVILQGTSVDVVATVTRNNGFDEAIELSVSGLPNGVSAAPVSVAKGATSATLTLSADAAAPHSLPTDAVVNGTSGGTSAQQGVTVTVRGPAGSLDTSFAGGGKAIVPVDIADDYAHAMAVQGDGKIVVAGWGHVTTGYALELVRLQRDGTLDTTFGTAGKVLTKIGSAAAEANAIAIQADGKILVAGSVNEAPKGKSFALVRYNADGSLDSGFGSSGIVTTSFGSQSDEAFAIAVQADGKIVLGGHAMSATRGLDFALARYEADGTLDFGFGTNGQVLEAIRAGNVRDSIYAIALQTIGGQQKIVAAGGEGDFAIARFNADGTRDSNFGVGERPDAEFGSVIGAARAVIVGADNKITVAGHVNEDWAILQLDADGITDKSFGSGGRVITKLSTTNWDEAQALVRQADGKIVVGGWVYAGAGSNGDFAVARYNADGTLDAGYGNAGITITPVAPGTKADQARAIVLQADERVPTVRSLLAGSANDSNYDFAVTRYWH